MDSIHCISPPDDDVVGAGGCEVVSDGFGTSSTPLGTLVTGGVTEGGGVSDFGSSFSSSSSGSVDSMNLTSSCTYI